MYDECISILSFIGQDCCRLNLLYQGLGLCNIVNLSAGERESRQLPSPDASVDLGRQPDARTAHIRTLFSGAELLAHPLWHFNAVSGRMRPFH